MMVDVLARKIAARKAVDELADADFVERADMLGGPYSIQGTPERGELIREVYAKWRPARVAAWHGQNVISKRSSQLT